MATAVSGSMKEAAITVSDWLLSFLKVRDHDLYNSVYAKMFDALEVTPLSSNVFMILLEHLSEIFNILMDVKKNGSIVIRVPNPTIQDEWIDTVKKSQEVLLEVEEYFVLLLQIAIYFDEQQDKGKNLGDILHAVTSNTTDLCEFRLKVVMHAYNMLQVNSLYRFATFMTFLKYAAKTGLFSVAVPYLQLIDDWQTNWNLTPKQRRDLYSLCAEQLTTEDCYATAAFAFLRRYVEACNNESEDVLRDEKTVKAACALIISSLKQPEVVYFDRIAEFDAIQHLRSTSHAPLEALLQIFVCGSPNDLSKFWSKHLDVIEKYDLDYHQLHSKLQLLTLTVLAVNSVEKGHLSFSDLSQQLDLTETEAEGLLVKAISQKLMDARIDQLNKVVHVTYAMQREFRRSEWEQLQKRLVAWIENTQRVVAALKGNC